MTPFGRQPVTAGLLATQAWAEAPAPARNTDKWALLRDLTAARTTFGVSDRTLAVLAALLSFHPGKELADDDKLIVFPSNASLSERAHGMPESTLRRHLAALMRAGLILRRDSPNGKRYATRARSGALDRVFGFDLRPLLTRSEEIARAAENTRHEALALRRLRETAVLRLRDAAKLIAWLQETLNRPSENLLETAAELQKRLRRKPEASALMKLASDTKALLDEIRSLISSETDEMSGDDNQIERHQHNSETYHIESESCHESKNAAKAMHESDPKIPLGLLLKAVPDMQDYAPDGIKSWRDLAHVADFVCPMVGISSDTWTEAQRLMGREVAATTLACMLQRVDAIARPGGYLRTLSRKAANGEFSPGPMVMALLRADNRQAA